MQPNYAIVWCDREGCSGGRVCTIYDCNLCTVIRSNNYSFHDYNIIKAQICFKSAKNNAFNFICCYLPPARNSTDNDRVRMLLFIENIITALSNKLPIFVLGDFNWHHINWQNSSLLSDSAEKIIFSCFMLEYGFLQVVDEPMHNQFIIDWIFVDNSNLLANVHCIENFSTSDHCNIIFDLLIPSSKLTNLEHNKNVLNYKAINWPAINAMLSNINWHFIENVHYSIQYVWKFFYNIIYMSFDLYVPIKTQKSYLKGNLPREIKLKAKKLKL